MIQFQENRSQKRWINVSSKQSTMTHPSVLLPVELSWWNIISSNNQKQPNRSTRVAWSITQSIIVTKRKNLQLMGEIKIGDPTAIFAKIVHRTKLPLTDIKTLLFSIPTDLGNKLIFQGNLSASQKGNQIKNRLFSAIRDNNHVKAIKPYLWCKNQLRKKGKKWFLVQNQSLVCQKTQASINFQQSSPTKAHQSYEKGNKKKSVRDSKNKEWTDCSARS